MKYPYGKSHEQECRTSVKRQLIQSTTSRILIAYKFDEIFNLENQVAHKKDCNSAFKKQTSSGEVSN